MIVLRADSNEKIGQGHMMRCIAIAHQLKRRGEDTLFITSDEYPGVLLKKEGFMHVVLHTDWMRMEEETEILSESLKKLKPECMLVDSYFATPAYFKKLNGFATLACMDDFGQQAYPVDTVINYNAYAKTIDYGSMYSGTNTQLLLGPKYAPLREEFADVIPKPVTGQVLDLMITTGSTDPYNVSGRLVNRMIRDSFFDGIRIHVVAGRYYTRKDELLAISQDFPQVIVHEGVNDMWALMTHCDIAVSAGGTTVYQLCTCGVPTVLFSFVDNQTKLCRFFGGEEVMVDCGDVRDLQDTCINNMIMAVKALAADKDKRIALREKARSITDGRGAMRIAACLLGG